MRERTDYDCACRGMKNREYAPACTNGGFRRNQSIKEDELFQKIITRRTIPFTQIRLDILIQGGKDGDEYEVFLEIHSHRMYPWAI